MPRVKKNQELPQKENAMFKSIVKFYELKQYKKGLKTADTILKKFPNHGETLAMKGLTLNCMKRKEEGFEFVRQGLKRDIRSHVCWHVYGLLYRSDNNYPEAVKCYQNAIRIDPENMQILRDMSLLQIQTRDLDGYVVTRRRLLALKPNNRVNWVSLAMAQHLNGAHDTALQVLQAFEGTQEADRPLSYEDSELLLYSNVIREESGDVEGALAALPAMEERVVDKLSLKQERARLLLQLGRSEEAAGLYRELLARNPEHYGYHRGLQCCLLGAPQWASGTACDLPIHHMALTEEQVSTLVALYAELSEQFPRCAAVAAIPLDFLQGDAFAAAIDAFLRPKLRKGIPALFQTCKPLYQRTAEGQKDKGEIIGELLAAYLPALETASAFPGDEADTEPPSTIVWTRMFAAQHHDLQGDSATAVALLRQAIAHTPTALDLYRIQARVLKRAGDLPAAVESVDHGRRLDLADRYINTKTTKYLLRSDKMEQAQATVALFTRHEGDPQANLFDMQVMWYELEAAESYVRLQQPGQALKKFHAVQTHFKDFKEDQFDFHTYCIRKSTLRAYLRLLRSQDSLPGHHFFTRAARGAIGVYCSLHDNPVAAAAAAAGGAAAADTPDYSAMTSAQRKRAKAKARKAAKKAKAAAAAKEAEEKAAAAKAKASGEGGRKKKGPASARKVDEDPNGDKLLATTTPLEEALSFVTVLLQHAPLDARSHASAFDVALRRGKLSQAARALNRALAVAPQGGDLADGISEGDAIALILPRLVTFVNTVRAPGTVLHPVVAEVIASQIDGWLQGASLADYVNAALARGSQAGQAAVVVAAAQALVAISQDSKQAAVDIISAAPCTTLPASVAAATALAAIGADAAAIEAFRAAAAVRYPFSTFFGGAQSSVTLAKAAGAGDGDGEAQ